MIALKKFFIASSLLLICQNIIIASDTDKKSRSHFEENLLKFKVYLISKKDKTAKPILIHMASNATIKDLKEVIAPQYTIFFKRNLTAEQICIWTKPNQHVFHGAVDSDKIIDIYKKVINCYEIDDKPLELTSSDVTTKDTQSTQNNDLADKSSSSSFSDTNNSSNSSNHTNNSSSSSSSSSSLIKKNTSYGSLSNE